MKRPRIILADDHRIVAEGLKSLLVDEFDLVAIVEDGRALLAAAKDLRPDVIVADISMPELNGIEAMIQLQREHVRAAFVFLTMHRDAVYARRAIEAGARGFVLKHSAPSELVMAIHAALKGETFITPAVAGEVLQSIQRSPDGVEDPVAMLTSRQRQILQLLTEGRSAKQMAAALNISSRTVEFHKYQMMDALDVKISADLIRFAIKHGVVLP